MKTHIQIDLLSLDTGKDGTGFHLCGWFRNHIFQSALFALNYFPKRPGFGKESWRLDFLFFVFTWGL